MVLTLPAALQRGPKTLTGTLHEIRRRRRATNFNIWSTSSLIENNQVSLVVSSSRAAPLSARRRYSAASSARPSDDSHHSTSNTSFSSPIAPGQEFSRLYGQPLPQTHPHLFPRRLSLASGASPHPDGGVAFDELTPGIPAQEYEDRRRRLMDRLPENSIVIALAGRVKIMSGAIFYRFRQDSNFFYLTGFQEPDAALIMEKDSSSRGYKMTMFVQPRDELNETWNGPRSGVDGTIDVFRADEAYPLEASSFLRHLKQILPIYDHVYVEPPQAPSVPRSTTSRGSRIPSIINYLSPTSPSGYDLFPKKSDFDAVVRLLSDPRKCFSLAREVDILRSVKSENELRVMKRAGDASGHAMTKTMEFAQPGGTEAALQATFEYHTALAGSQRPAYVPVVAAGSNALTIHYVSNDNVLRPHDLVCIDAGCELDGYASDITRAFPTSGTFTSPQRDLYAALLRVLASCTALATEHQCYTLSELHRRSVEMLRLELKDLGFDLKTGVLERILYPHYLGHWLGLDLHDTPTLERTTRLRQGMVLTIEPGIYVPFDDAFPRHFQGIGIRIEDDVAVGVKDNIVLSANAPKEIIDVEAACQRFLETQEQLRTSLPHQPTSINGVHPHTA